MIKKDYQTLLSYEQKVKYKAAINQGYFDDYHSLAWRHTFYGAFIWKYPRRIKVLTRFKDLLGHLPQWEDITDDNLRDLHSELCDQYAPNSVKTICAELCALIRENQPTKSIPSEMFGTIIKARKVPVQSVYLNRKEIETLDLYEPRRVFERYVKRLFMVECLTGARKSDCARLSLENVVEENGHKFIRYVSQKSKVQVTVPLDRRVSKYLVPCSPLEPKGMTTWTYNVILQRICKACGINERCKVFEAGKEEIGRKWTFVSSHTGRRSFATNLAKRGVSLEQIAMMMGHMAGNVPNVTMTQRYIVGSLKIDAKVIAMFEN